MVTPSRDSIMCATDCVLYSRISKRCLLAYDHCMIIFRINSFFFLNRSPYTKNPDAIQELGLFRFIYKTKSSQNLPKKMDQTMRQRNQME